MFLVGLDGLIAQSILDNTELSISNSCDSKYISEGRDNIESGLELSYQLIDNLSLNAYIASSYIVWDEATNENHTWCGISISTEF